ncbi:MAG: hypothetical protein JJ896_13485 [Rhodothermales bacterium]|nr:hypothetical protein [Rhodothermales bacterium]MBO6780660.1 hypothetical protein [Rhodothermales bacterium]
MAQPEGYVIDDDLVAPELSVRGIAVHSVPWQQVGREDWSHVDGVVVRSTWDYYNDPDAFLEVLASVPTRMMNPLDTLRWNIDKRYLLDLRDSGVPIVPTRLVSDGRRPGPLDYPSVVKPRVSANSEGACVLRSPKDHARLPEGPSLVQPFVAEILGEGELSLFFFDREFSHAIRKTPATGDFRVQEEHGGLIQPFTPPAEALETARRALQAVDGPLLYARVDLVPFQGRHVVMELELIEPSMYLRMHPEAPARFAAAITAWLRP